jgi:ABC-type Fe3+-siderophore transport system permease subunit
MDWYAPLLILPAIGMIIVSTGHFIVALTSELSELERDIPRYQSTIRAKVKQLKRLGRANAMLYTGALFFMFSSLTQAVFVNPLVFKGLMLAASICVTIALIFLFIHSIKAVSIRDMHLRIDDD